MKEVRLDISGMSCGHCVGRVQRALEAVPGASVRSVEIGSATVAFDPSQTTTDRIATAVNDAGYEARVDSSAG